MRRSNEAAGGARARLRVVAEPPPPRPAPQKAGAVKLLRRDTVADAAVCVFSAALDHYEANVPAFLAEPSPESVHQMRVALRRLRAAIGLFEAAMTGPALDAAREGARALAETLGAARNWDVFHDMLTAGPAEALQREPGFYALLDAIELRRAEAYRAARDAVEGPRAAGFLADFRAAIGKRAWAAAPEAREDGGARDFAARRLAKLRKRLLKKAKGLDRQTPEARHKTRIALKKMRYAAEFFESLFSGDAAADFSARLAKMQDGLGAFNDMETANPLLDEIDAAPDSPAVLRASGFVRGWFARAAQAGAGHAKKSEKRLRRLRAFW